MLPEIHIDCISTAATRPAVKRLLAHSSNATISSHVAQHLNTCSKPVFTAGGRTSISRYLHYNRSRADADP